MSVRESEIAKIAESKDAKAALEKHLEEVIEGPAFKGSNRSGLFLRHVIHRAISGNFDSLKERSIGMELFGRSASYVTGEDAIVRVTANDVRKRLAQHYDKYRTESEFRINLPPGSYIPEIIWANGSEPVSLPDKSDSLSEPVEPLHLEAASPEVQKPVPDIVADSVFPDSSGKRSHRRWVTSTYALGALSLVLLGILIYGVVLLRSVHPGSAATSNNPASVLPWSVFLSSQSPTHFVTSDPDLVSIQIITGHALSVADYANHNYIPPQNTLSPEVKSICLRLLRGDKAASTDTRVAADVAALAQSGSRKIDVETARSLQFSNLKTDDNFIFMGSPRSDPWVSLFDDQLDFQFVIDSRGLESVHNVRPRPQEQPLYTPTAGGGFTGQSFAIVAFVRNPDQNGNVLLLAGANAEGTEAAGKLATDVPRLSMELQKCGVSSRGPLQHFEFLLRLNMMAGSPSRFDVEACHILQEPPSH